MPTKALSVCTRDAFFRLGGMETLRPAWLGSKHLDDPMQTAVDLFHRHAGMKTDGYVDEEVD